MRSSALTNIFLLVCGGFALVGGYRMIGGAEWLMGGACIAIGLAFVVMALAELFTGQGLLDLLSHPEAAQRRWAIGVFILAIIGFVALSLAAIMRESGLMRVVGVIGVLFFGIGGAFAVLAYWYAPAQDYSDQAISRAHPADEDGHPTRRHPLE